MVECIFERRLKGDFSRFGVLVLLEEDESGRGSGEIVLEDNDYRQEKCNSSGLP